MINFMLSSPGTSSICTPPAVSFPSIRDCGRFCQRIYPGGPALARTITVARPNTIATRNTAAIALLFRRSAERANQMPANEIARNIKVPAMIVRVELCMTLCTIEPPSPLLAAAS
jgi:hypothetical protein